MFEKRILFFSFTILFLFFLVESVSAEQTLEKKKINIYVNNDDGYIINWIKKVGNNQMLWDETHDAILGSNFSSFERDFIEVGTGWTPHKSFFIHRTLMGFDLSDLPTEAKIVSARLKIFPYLNTITVDDEHSYISLVLANNENNQIDLGDYNNIGESNEFGWNNSFNNDMILGSEKKMIKDIPINEYVDFEFNKESLGWLKEKILYIGLREGHDLDDVCNQDYISNWVERVIYYSSERSNTVSPYLEIEYELPEDKLDPVVLIPGIIGSWEVDGELVLDPLLRVYDDLWDALKLSGYKEGENLFAFPYEWRKSNVINAELLGEKIADIKEATGVDKVDIIGHSMGGLLARQYLSDNKNAENVDQLIFLATPHQGSPEAYLTWEGGYLGSGLSGFAKNRIFIQEAHENGYSDIRGYINDNVVTVSELLPTYSYLLEKESGELRNYPENYPRNLLLEFLNAPDVLEDLKQIDVNNFVGMNGENTVKQIAVNENGLNGSWKHGEPKSFNKSLVMGMGDDTVPEESNLGFNDFYTIVKGSGHGEIVSDSQSEIIEALTGEAPVTIVKEHGMNKKLLLFQVFSPVDMTIENSSGETLGKDTINASNKMEIYDSYYTGFEAKAEFASILNPLAGKYDISLEGVSEGPFRLLISLIDDDKVIEKEFSGHIKNGQVFDFVFNFDNDDISLLKCSLFDAILKDLDDYNNSGEIGDGSVYMNMKEKLEHLKETYEKMEIEDSVYKSYINQKYIVFQLEALKIHLAYYAQKDWVKPHIYDKLKEDLNYIINVL